MLRSILVETGDSPYAASAMATAQWLAKAFRARLYALTCLDSRSVESEHIRRMLEQHTEARQARLEAECRQAGIECVAQMEVGDPRAAVAHLSRKADLTILGSAAESDESAGVFSATGSSLARELVRHAMVVRETPPTFKHIVVGYAGQENSCNALQLAAHIAEKAKGTVHVLSSSADLAKANALLDVAVAYLGAYKVKAVPHYTTQEAGDALFQLVNEVGADLVAIGALRRSRVTMMAFGDTASRVLDNSPASVLIGR
ncbi:MAG TPA: universal stress protein [Planctomycetota bacterium]|nr:universal stress protein [Planctomycetota bacterium]HRR82814.1 universal stress protein [Planctomycetota bacterium]